jgi:hypothetical protein
MTGVQAVLSDFNLSNVLEFLSRMEKRKENPTELIVSGKNTLTWNLGINSEFEQRLELYSLEDYGIDQIDIELVCPTNDIDYLVDATQIVFESYNHQDLREVASYIKDNFHVNLMVQVYSIEALFNAPIS